MRFRPQVQLVLARLILRHLSVILGFVLISFFPSPSCAQFTNISNTTATPIPGVGHDYIKMLNETVDPANGSLSLNFQFPVPPGRGMSAPIALAYNSSGVHFLTQNGTLVQWQGTSPGGTGNPFEIGGGWKLNAPSLSFKINSIKNPTGDPTGECDFQNGFVFNDERGSRHSLALLHIIRNTTFNCNFYSNVDEVDSATEGPYQAKIDAQGNLSVAGPDGTVYEFGAEPMTYHSASAEDANGNGAGFGATGISDDLGRSTTITYVQLFPTSVTVSSLSNPFSITSGATGASGVGVNANFLIVNPAPNGSCAHEPNGGSGILPAFFASSTNMTTLTLPNGQTYQFQYDPTYGLLSKVIYPGGGYVSYTWGLNSLSDVTSLILQVPNQLGNPQTELCEYRHDFYAVTHRSVSFDGVNVALQQDFNYSTTWSAPTNQSIRWQTKQTTVTTHDLTRPGQPSFQTIYTYTPVDAPRLPPPGQEYGGQIPLESSIVYKDTSGAVLRTVNKTWQDQYRLAAQCVTLDNGATSGSFYTFGSGNQITDEKEFDFGVIASGTCTLPTATPTRETVTAYQSFPATPLYPAAPSIFNRPSSAKTYGNGTLVAETDYAYDQTAVASVTGSATTHDDLNYGTTSTAPRGNPTTITKQCLPTCTSAVTTYAFNVMGQPVSMVDPNGNAVGGTPSQHTTQYSYLDSFTVGAPATNTNAYLTSVTHPPTNGVAHTESYSYSFADGQLTQSKDQNSRVTNYIYNDPLGRLTETDSPDGGVATITYNDTARTVTSSRKLTPAGLLMTSVALMDGMGHVVQTQLTSDPQGTVFTDTTYDALGRVATVSNPHRTCGTDPTSSCGTTTYGYDALGRKTSESYPDSSVLQTAYCAASTLVTDPTGKWRRSRADGLGRLVEVDEPNAVGATVASTGCPASGGGEPIFVTTYSFDAVGNMTSVVQNGSHQRTFTYDSLSRLLTANNPETGTITYTYDADSNVATKKDARAITTTYSYDALNRLLGTTYSNGDPSVSYKYDEANCLGLSACQNIGHRTSMTDAAGSEAWSFQVDKTNSRNLHNNQRTNGTITKKATYILDLAGNTTQLTYPTGRIVNFAFDSANRPSTAADGSNGITYAAGFDVSPGGTCSADVTCYTPQGTFYALSIGETASFTGLNLSHSYNNRLQPQEFKATSTGGNALDITYNFVDPTTSKNAGHVYAIANNLNFSRSQSFTYDQLNRITSAGTSATSGTTCWGYQYSYDAWGNLLAQSPWTPNYNGCTQTNMAPVTADGNNHISGLSYDLSGNTQNDGSFTYAWDAESQLKSAAGVNYLYDGDGRRVSKSNGKLYWYGSGSEILAETDAAGSTTAEYIFFGGKRIAMLPSGGTPIYYVEDLLGTSRVTTTNSGVVCYDADFYPYGGERIVTNTCPQNNYKFEGKERDSETGNDDFGARYYSNRFGRWLSADWSAIPIAVPYANLTNPQTLNLYAMVGDDPETFADLDGHECFDDGSCNALRNPLSADHWVLNGLSNTVSDLLSLDTVAHGAAAAGNSDLPTKDRVIGGAKVIGVAVVDTVGGEIAGKVLGKAAGAILGKSGIEAAVQLGKEGEALAGIVKNTERIESLTTGGAVKYRVPDVLDRAAGVIGEVKNVTRQGLTAQIKDDIAFAAKNNLKFELHVNKNTTFTKPLQKLINSGVVNVIRF